MEFLVLGPLVAVSDAGTPLDLGPPKARAALAVLLCRAGQVVGVDAIVDALWPVSPPAAAVKNVQLYVHQLRRALGDADRIIRRNGGYLLAAEPDEIDAQRFTGLCTRHRMTAIDGDLDGARSLLVQALQLWRGEQAYAGLGDTWPVAAEAHRLAEARLAALSSRIDIDMRLAGHADLVPELAGLTGQYPLHERFWAQLMITLQRSGRPAEALAAYDRARRILAAETGLDPGAELRHLQQAILAGDHAADLVSVPPLGSGDSVRVPRPSAGQGGGAAVPDTLPRMLPPDTGDFTGRLGELETIMAALGNGQEPDGGGHPARAVAVAALSGQGGVGKTALAVHAAHRLASNYPDGQLFVALSGAHPAPVDPDEVLARFLRALGVAGRAVPDTGAERAALYRSLVSGRRLLVVLDDAADEVQVRPLLPGAASCAVIVTSRARLGALPGAHHVDLAPLPSEDGLRLLERMTGPRRAASDPDATCQLVRLCAGLPLALRIAGSRLASRPHWSTGELVAQLADEHKRLDALQHRDLGVRASFALSYRGLEPAQQRLFRLLGLVEAPDVTVWTAAALLDTTAGEAGDLLEVLADARLVDVIGPDEAGHPRYRFHDLVRLYARELAETEETQQARISALRRVFGALLSFTDAVHRAGEGGDYTIIVGDAPRWHPAGAQAAIAESASPLAWLRAERLALAGAVRQAAALSLDEYCWELAAGAEFLYQMGGYNDDWQETHQLALAATEAAGNQRGHAMMLHLLASCHYLRRDITQAKDYTNRALALFGQIGERYGCALAQRKLAEYERNAGHVHSAVTLARQARGQLTALGDPVAAADCLILEGIARLEDGDPAAAAEVSAEAVSRGRAIGSRIIIAHASYWLALALIALGRCDEAAAAVDALAQFVRTVDDRIGAIYACHARGSLARARRNLAAARSEFEAGLRAACEIRDPLMQVRLLISLGELCQTEARHREAIGLLTEAAAVSEARGFVLQRARALQRLDDMRTVAGDLRSAGGLRGADVVTGGLRGAHPAGQQATAIAAEMDPRRCGASRSGP